MHRYELEDRHWERIEDLFPQVSRGRPWQDHRMIVNGILWILLAVLPGATCRDVMARGRPPTVASGVGGGRGLGIASCSGSSFGPDKKRLLDYSQSDIDSTSVRAARASAGASKRGTIHMSPRTRPGPLAWRKRHQNPPDHRSPRPADALYAHAGTDRGTQSR
jgi:hypothetical protein